MTNTTSITTVMPNPHSEHCRDCKVRLHELLTALYRDACHKDYLFPWPSSPKAYDGTHIGDILQCIYTELKDYRGYGGFIRSPRMPPCDYYIENPGFILEFDERQHFSRPRGVTLDLYPADLRMGFSLQKWHHLCTVLRAEDPNPPDRDERRAWYDCLRDLLPTVHGLGPTIRLYEGALPWCELQLDSPEDIRTFMSFLQGSHSIEPECQSPSGISTD